MAAPIRRLAWRFLVAVGALFIATGAAAYMWIPNTPALIVGALGVLLCGPLWLCRDASKDE
jgi:hypothetical protein